MSRTDGQLSELRQLMGPVQARTRHLSNAHKNLTAVHEETSRWLEQLEVSWSSGALLERGFEDDDSDALLACVDRLVEAEAFFSRRRAYKGAESSWRHAGDLLDKSLERCEETFARLLFVHDRAADSPPRARRNPSRRARRRRPRTPARPRGTRRGYPRPWRPRRPPRPPPTRARSPRRRRRSSSSARPRPRPPRCSSAASRRYAPPRAVAPPPRPPPSAPRRRRPRRRRGRRRSRRAARRLGGRPSSTSRRRFAASRGFSWTRRTRDETRAATRSERT